jgi:hypothetical protein
LICDDTAVAATLGGMPFGMAGFFNVLVLKNAYDGCQQILFSERPDRTICLVRSAGVSAAFNPWAENNGALTLDPDGVLRIGGSGSALSLGLSGLDFSPFQQSNWGIRRWRTPDDIQTQDVELHGGANLRFNGVPVDTGTPLWETTGNINERGSLIHKGRNVLFADAPINAAPGNPRYLVLKTNVRADDINLGSAMPITSQITFRAILSGVTAPAPNQLRIDMEMSINAELSRNDDGAWRGSINAVVMNGRIPTSPAGPRMSSIRAGLDNSDGMICFIIGDSANLSTNSFKVSIPDVSLKRTMPPRPQDWATFWVDQDQLDAQFMPQGLTNWIRELAVVPAQGDLSVNRIDIPLINGRSGILTLYKSNGVVTITGSVAGPAVPTTDVIATIPAGYRPGVGLAPGIALAASHQFGFQYPVSAFINTSNELRLLEPPDEPLRGYPVSISGMYPSDI